MEINEPIDQQKKLNIIAIADDSEYGTSAVCYGGMLAAVFRASLTVITKFDFTLEERKGRFNAERVLQNVQQLLAHDIETILLTDFFFPERLYHYAEETNTIMFVLGVDGEEKQGFFDKRKAMRFIKPSRLPVMTVGKKLPEKDVFQHVLLPLDIERQAKEKALWAGYFSRFYQATIHILAPHYKDSGLQKQVSDNIAFVEKLYKNLEIGYTIHEVAPMQDIDRYSIEYAPEVGASLTVIMMTKYLTPATLLTGKREKKIIGNPQQFPVLCINQRDDLYVLCT